MTALKGFKLDTSSTTIVVGLVAIVIVYQLIKKAGAAAIDAAANVNAGTPYAGYGLPGTLGNAANQLSGGWLADQGTQLGAWLDSVINPTPSPAPPVDWGLTGGWNDPTSSAAPAGIALPSAKQAVQDNFWTITPALTPMAQ